MIRQCDEGRAVWRRTVRVHFLASASCPSTSQGQTTLPECCWHRSNRRCWLLSVEPNIPPCWTANTVRFSIAGSQLWHARHFTWFYGWFLTPPPWRGPGHERPPSETRDAPRIVPSFGCSSGLHRRLLFMPVGDRKRHVHTNKPECPKPDTYTCRQHTSTCFFFLPGKIKATSVLVLFSSACTPVSLFLLLHSTSITPVSPESTRGFALRYCVLKDTFYTEMPQHCRKVNSRS